MLTPDQLATTQSRSRSQVQIPNSSPPSRSGAAESDRTTQRAAAGGEGGGGGGVCCGLYHRAHRVERGVEADGFGLGRLHVGVVHRVLEGGLAVGALVADVAIELDFGTCPGRKKKTKKKTDIFTPET